MILFFKKHMKGFFIWYAGAILAIVLATVTSYGAPFILQFTMDLFVHNPSAESNWISDILVSIGNALSSADIGFGESMGAGYFLHNLWLVAVALVMITGINGIFSYISGSWTAVASEGMAEKIKNALYDHIQKLPYEYHVKAKTGDLIQRCTSDVDTVRSFLAIQFVEIGRVISLIAFAVPVLFGAHVNLAIVSLALFPFIFALSIYFFMQVEREFRKVDESEGELSTVLQEGLAGVRVVRAFGREQHEVERFDQRNRDYRDKVFKLIKQFAYYWSASDFLSIAQFGVILVYGSIMAVNGEIGVGQLVLFLTVVGMLQWPIRQLGRILSEAGKASVAIERISEIFDIPQEDWSDTETADMSQGIEFNNVSFSYTKDHPVLSNISFKLEAGKTLGIIGPTGSGKSTLVQLLPRLYDYSEGEILIGGVPLKYINKEWIRSRIGIVLQEPFLYAKTVKKNIGISREDMDDLEVFEAARTASIHDVIHSFNDEYETMIGERGVNLSGGQKQRVAIARAIASDSDVLIFDDSLSALDTETDRAIRESLERMPKKASRIIISHRLSSVQNADTILVLEHGKISRMGSHRELIQQEGLYKKLYEIQSMNADDGAENDSVSGS